MACLQEADYVIAIYTWIYKPVNSHLATRLIYRSHFPQNENTLVLGFNHTLLTTGTRIFEAISYNIIDTLPIASISIAGNIISYVYMAITNILKCHAGIGERLL